jgi:hypothetical protein
MNENEHVRLENTIGIVTNKKLVLKYKNGNEEIPISKVTSVSFIHKRGYFFAIGNFALTAFLLIACFFTINQSGAVYGLVILIISIFSMLTGIANWIGNYDILISINGNNRKPLSVSFSKTKEGLDLVNSIKKEISN